MRWRCFNTKHFLRKPEQVQAAKEAEQRGKEIDALELRKEPQRSDDDWTVRYQRSHACSNAI